MSRTPRTSVTTQGTRAGIARGHAPEGGDDDAPLGGRSVQQTPVLRSAGDKAPQRTQKSRRVRPAVAGKHTRTHASSRLRNGQRTMTRHHASTRAPSTLTATQGRGVSQPSTQEGSSRIQKPERQSARGYCRTVGPPPRSIHRACRASPASQRTCTLSSAAQMGLNSS
jgi:hypothetical protein